MSWERFGSRGWIGLLGLVVVATSCSGLSEAEQVAVLATEVEAQVGFLDGDESACVAETVLAQDRDGVTTGADLVADAEDGNADLLAFVDTDVGAAAVADCVDLEARLASYMSSEFGETLTPGCVESDEMEASSLQPALITDMDSRSDWIDDDDLRSELVAVARGCVSDIAFAALAGLDDPRELASVLVGDPFAKYDDLAYQDACVSEAIVTAVGIERLAEVDVTVEEPELVGRLGDLGGVEHEEITVELRQCDPRHLVERLVEGAVPQLVECVSAGLDDDEINELIGRAIAGRTVVRQDPIRELINTCSSDRAAELFGPAADHSSDVHLFVNGLIAADDVGSTNEFEYECMEAGFLSYTTDEVLTEIEPYLIAVYEGEYSSQASVDAWTNLMRSYTEVTQVCLSHWAFITADLELAGVSEASWPCIELQLDPDSVAYARELFFEAVFEASPAGLNRLEDLLNEVGEIIQDCGTGSDKLHWNQYMDDLFGSPSNPLDESETPQST